MSTTHKRQAHPLRLLTFQPKPAPAKPQELSTVARKMQALYELAPDSARILEGLIDNITADISSRDEGRC